MKIFFSEGIGRKACFRSFKKACDHAINETMKNFRNLNPVFNGHTRWIEDSPGHRRFKIYFNEGNTQREPICAYVDEYETDD